MFTALEKLGGYSNVLEVSYQQLVDEQLGNPRFQLARVRLDKHFEEELPRLRGKLRRLMALVEWGEGETEERNRQPIQGGGLARGPHPEVWLESPRMGWRGRADLIVVHEDGVEIIDFKTGQVSDSHRDQLAVYAVLWRDDVSKNPRKMAVKSLTLRYPAADSDVPVPSQDECSAIADALRERSLAARAAVASVPPPALPASDKCLRCDVRQLCDVYWGEPYWIDSLTRPAGFADASVVMLSQLAPRSWRVELDGPEVSGRILRVHFSQAHDGLRVNDRLRLIGFAVRLDESEMIEALSEVSSSEWFRKLENS